MLKLKLQNLDSLEKTLMLGKSEGTRDGKDRGGDDWMASLTQWAWVWASSRRWWKTGKPGMLQSMGSQRVGHDWVTQQHNYFPTPLYLCGTAHTLRNKTSEKSYIAQKKLFFSPTFVSKWILLAYSFNIHSSICSNQQLESIKRTGTATNCYSISIKCYHRHCTNTREV